MEPLLVFAGLAGIALIILAIGFASSMDKPQLPSYWSEPTWKRTTEVPDSVPWEVRRFELERKAQDEWDTEKNTGECLLCGRPMREHPPERMFTANPAWCPKEASSHA